jgi:predicted RNA-binding Zn-ribbon protein involved in translation (DUF1610 family)
VTLLEIVRQLDQFDRGMTIYSKDAADHRCPACGKVHVFGLEAFIRKAIEQGKKMLRTTHGRR